MEFIQSRSARKSALGVLAFLTLAAIAFGFIEAAVVVYLRAIAYPDGFRFPLAAVPARILATEIAREAATLLLLAGMAGAAAREGRRRFAAFAFCFGVWDIVYYAALKILLDWPETWLDWDVLFLIPAPWTSPVLAPLLVSVGLIAGGAALFLRDPARPLRIRPVDWGLEILAGLLVLASFFWNAPGMAQEQEPAGFPWWLFAAGWLLGAAWLARIWRRTFRSLRS